MFSRKIEFFEPRCARVVYLSVFSPDSLRNSDKGGGNAAQRKPNAQDLHLLFNEILDIVGHENFTNTSGGLIVSREPNLKKESFSNVQPPTVCGNASDRHKQMMEGKPAESERIVRKHEKPEPVKIRKSIKDEGSEVEVEAVNAIVNKVTQIIITSEKGLIPMEEKLESVDLHCNEEIVHKVLKNCSKVPHLALRFFNLVKLRDRFQHSTNTLKAMIDIGVEAKDFGLLEEVVDEIKKNHTEIDINTWNILVSQYGQAKMTGKCLLLFEEMMKAGVHPDATTYRTLLFALCSAGKSELALEFYKEMVQNEMDIDLVLYKNLLKCLVSSGNDLAVRLVGEEMVRHSGIPETQALDLMLKSLCYAGKIKESLELIRDFRNKGLVLDNKMLGTLVKGLCSKGMMKESEEVLEIMKKKGIVPDRIAYEVLVSSYLRENKVSEAFSFSQVAKESGVIMSAGICKDLMLHLFRKNEFQKGLVLYNEMLSKGIQLDGVSMTYAAVGYVHENQIDEAWEVFQSMHEKGIKLSPDSYLMFIKELSKVSAPDEILGVLKGMQTTHVKVGDKMYRVIESYLGMKGGRRELTSERKPRQSFPLHLALPDERKTEQCDQLEPVGTSDFNGMEEQKHTEERSVSYHDVEEVSQILRSSTDWFFIQGKLDKLPLKLKQDDVLEIMNSCRVYLGNSLKFFSWIDNKPGYSHNERTYHLAMKIAGKGKDFKMMRSLFYQMKRQGCPITSDTWTIMITQYARTGLTDIALKVFEEMKLSGFKPSKTTYHSLITLLCEKKGRKVDDAIKIYKEMVKQGYAVDKKVLETYVTCLCEMNKLSEAKSCIKSLPKFGFSVPLSYSLYFRALCRAGKLEDALALANEIGSERRILEKYTYGSLVHGLLRRGQLEEALSKIEYMKQNGIYPTVHVYTALIVHFLKQKEIQRALHTLDEMKEQGCNPTIVTYSALICGYVRLGKVQDAWNIFHSLRKNGPSPDFKTYSMFIECLCNTGRSEEAVELISEMMEDKISPSTINFRSIIWGLNREGKPHLSKVVLKKKLDLKRSRMMVKTARLIPISESSSCL